MAEPTPAEMTIHQLLVRMVELLQELIESVDQVDTDVWGLNELTMEILDGPNSLHKKNRKARHG